MATHKWRKARAGEGVYRLLAMTTVWFPDFMVIGLAHLLGPRMVGKVNFYLPSEAIARLSRKLPPRFIADVAMSLDAEAREHVVPCLPYEVVFNAARPLIDRRAFVETAQFAALLSRANLKLLVLQLNDLPGVAQITGHLPPEKIAEVLLAFSPQLGAKLIDEMVAQGFGEVIASVQHHFSGLRRRQLLDVLGAAARPLFPETSPLQASA